MVKKPKKIKDRLLAARVDEDFQNVVNDYTEAADILPLPTSFVKPSKNTC